MLLLIFLLTDIGEKDLLYFFNNMMSQLSIARLKLQVMLQDFREDLHNLVPNLSLQHQFLIKSSRQIVTFCNS